MSAGVAVSPSTAAAGLAPDIAPRAKVSIEASRKTVTAMRSIRPTGTATPTTRDVRVGAWP